MYGQVSKRIFCRLFLPRLSQHSRTLYSDKYLGFDMFQKKRIQTLQSIPDKKAFLNHIHDNVMTSPHNVMKEDIMKMIDMAENDQGLEDAGKLLSMSLKKQCLGYPPDFPQLMTMYLSACKMFNCPESATKMWFDDNMQQCGIFNLNNLRLRYFMILYEAQRYEEILALFRKLDQTNLHDDTFGMAALYKIGTKEAFKEAQSLYGRMIKNGGRATLIFALFAHNMGKLEVAYKALTNDNYTSKKSKFNTNLKLKILTKAERLKDALTLIRTEMLPMYACDSSFAIVYKVMQELAEKVKSSQDDELITEMTELCQILDDTVAMTEDSVEQLVFAPIDHGRKVKTAHQRKMSRVKRKDLYSED